MFFFLKETRGIPQHFESFGTVLASNMGRSTLVGLGNG
jgi:hypothetical protein